MTITKSPSKYNVIAYFKKITRALDVVPKLSFYLKFLVKKEHNSKTIALRVISPCLVTAPCHDKQVFQV